MQLVSTIKQKNRSISVSFGPELFRWKTFRALKPKIDTFRSGSSFHLKMTKNKNPYISNKFVRICILKTKFLIKKFRTGPFTYNFFSSCFAIWELLAEIYSRPKSLFRGDPFYVEGFFTWKLFICKGSSYGKALLSRKSFITWILLSWELLLRRSPLMRSVSFTCKLFWVEALFTSNPFY